MHFSVGAFKKHVLFSHFRRRDVVKKVFFSFITRHLRQIVLCSKVTLSKIGKKVQAKTVCCLYVAKENDFETVVEITAVKCFFNLDIVWR